MIAELDVTRVLILFVVLIISLTFHEAAHALFAKLGGDLTAYHGGQVTLNPIPHMKREPFGMLVLPILSIVMSNATMCFGFAHAPIDAVWAERHPRKAALMSAAGPLSNTLLATAAFLVLYFLGRPDGAAGDAVQRIAMWFLLLNLLLALFNLIPLPPLDGAGVVSGAFPRTRAFYRTLAATPGAALLVIVGLFFGIQYLFWPVYYEVIALLPFYRGPY